MQTTVVSALLLARYGPAFLKPLNSAERYSIVPPHDDSWNASLSDHFAHAFRVKLPALRKFCCRHELTPFAL